VTAASDSQLKFQLRGSPEASPVCSQSGSSM